MKALTASAFRQNLKRYLDAVADEDEVVIIPRGGEDGRGVAVISLDRFGEMDETERIRQNPKRAAWLQASIREVESGDTVVYDPDSANGFEVTPETNSPLREAA